MESTSDEQNAMSGIVSLTFKGKDDFNRTCSRLAKYNPERFEAVALRVYTGEETIVTIYAFDKMRNKAPEEHHLPVHKFKLELPLQDFIREIRQMNFTVSDNRFDLWDMEVTNK